MFAAPGESGWLDNVNHGYLLSLHQQWSIHFSLKWTTVFSPVPISQVRSLNAVVVLLSSIYRTTAMARLELCSLTFPITGLQNGG